MTDALNPAPGYRLGFPRTHAGGYAIDVGEDPGATYCTVYGASQAETLGRAEHIALLLSDDRERAAVTKGRQLVRSWTTLLDALAAEHDEGCDCQRADGRKCPRCGAALHYWPMGDEHACSMAACKWPREVPACPNCRHDSHIAERCAVTVSTGPGSPRLCGCEAQS